MDRTHMRFAAVIVVVLAVGLSACGRKGDPVAPVAETAAPMETQAPAAP